MYGRKPPEADSVWEYLAPSPEPGTDAVVMVSDLAMLMVNWLEAVALALSVTCTANE